MSEHAPLRIAARAFGDDLRQGLRALRRTPAFAAVAIVTLALGIGANVAIFSVVSGVLLRPLPYRDPERLVVVHETMPGNDARGAAPANFLDWRRDSRTFEGLAGYFTSARTLSGSDAAVRVQVASASANLFTLLGATPAQGRGFVAEEDSAGATPAVVLSYAFWMRQFGGSPRVVGGTIDLDGARYTVVGTMGPDFSFPERVDLWSAGIRGVPELPGFPGDIAQERDVHYFTVLGRLRAGTSLPAAQREMDAVARRIDERFPKDNAGLGVRLVPLHEAIAGGTRLTLLLLFAVVGCVLLIASANVANLLLARAVGRRHELAIRAAIGASRWRIAGQLLAESMLLALAGGALGVAIAAAGVPALLRASPVELPVVSRVGLDGRVLGFAFLVSVGAGLLFGLAPALHGWWGELQDAMRDGAARGTDRRITRRLRGALVVGEIALSLALLVGAGLLVESFQHLLAVRPGFEAQHVLTLDVALSPTAYDAAERRAAYLEQLMARARAQPGVQTVGLVDQLPLSGGSMNRGVDIEGAAPPQRPDERTVEYRVVGGAYFRALGIPLRRGRDFGPTDRADAAGVALVNEATARRYFGAEDPVGRRIAFGGSPAARRWRTIVGIVGDVRHFGLDQLPRPEVYVPLEQDPPMSASLAVRTLLPPAQLAPSLRLALQAIDPAQPIYAVQPMAVALERSLTRQRFLTALLGAFALVALSIATVGVYAVMAFSVGRRVKEIGIRMALGAERGTIVRMVLLDAWRLIAAGLLVGSALALAGGRAMASLLFGVTASDPTAFLGMLLALALAATLASYLPARRAAAVDPVRAIRAP